MAEIRNRVADIARPSTEFPRRFVPADSVVKSWADIEPPLKELLERKLDSVEAIEQWLLDSSELQSVLSEEGSRRYIAMTCATDDKEAEAAFLDFIENIQPRIMPIADQLNRKLIDSPHAERLDPQRYEVLLRSCRNSIELFREENVPLKTELNKLSQQYQKITGSQSVEFNGKEHTLQQMAVYLEESDRELRQRAWEATAGRRLQDAEALDDLLDRMLELRGQVAENAGFANFRDYQFRAYERFDYTPEDCYRFHEAVERHVVPVLKESLEERRKALGIESVRPWDVACDPHGRPPLRPFDNTDVLAHGCREIFGKVDADLGEQFQVMMDRGLLDLDSRKGKAPGGYQQELNENRLPFIFTNAVGLNRDVFTLLHEGGHAFHNFAVRGEAIMSYRHAPMEFSEVASMAMELLSIPHLGAFYKQHESARTARDEWDKKIALFAWIATVDAFQHWLYTNSGHTREQRADFWVSLAERFGGGVDHSGYEEALRKRWQAQLHIFEVPFYYIEYGIAQLGAMQVWSNSRKDTGKAVESYKAALAMGGSRPLPELYRAAGIEFDFSEATIQPLMREVQDEMNRLAKAERQT